MRGRGRARWTSRSAPIIALSCGWLACAPSNTPPPAGPSLSSRGAPLQFRYAITDGRTWLASDALRGKPSVIGFLTTYDVASQAEARFLNGIARRHGQKIQVAAVILEPADNRMLMNAFRDGLELAYPLAIADADVIAGGGPFGDVHAVPSTVLLDAEGRLVWKSVGLTREEPIEKALSEL